MPPLINDGGLSDTYMARCVIFNKLEVLFIIETLGLQFFMCILDWVVTLACKINKNTLIQISLVLTIK